MKYLKLFENHRQYEDYVASGLTLPNVSHCIQEIEVHYGPFIETRVVCKYNVTSTSEPTALRTNYEQNVFKSMEVDGRMLDELVTAYTFDTVGVHTVKYELYDETKLGNGAPTFYNNNLIEATIPSGVTTIGMNAFNNCTSLSSCTFDENSQLTSIGGTAFNNCSGLTSINIPSGVTSIGSTAFASCYALTSCTFEENSQLTSIGNTAFASCSGLTSIDIPSGVTSIGNYAFASCRSLTSVSIDSNAIVSSAYTSTTNMKNIFGSQVEEYVIGDNVTNIGSQAFYGCSGLTSCTIGSGVTSIGTSAFVDCSDLTSVTFDKNSRLTSIGDAAFLNCHTIASINIPNSVTSIGGDAFNSCYALTSINIPSGVTSIGNMAFFACTNLTSINIPSGLTTIGEAAFASCSGLTSIDIPNSVTSIGYSAFAGCSSLTSMTVNSSNTTYDSRNNCNAIIKTSTNQLFFGCKNTVIPNTVTSIGNHAFRNCTSLTSIDIPNSVTSIGQYAFYNCNALTSVTSNATTAPTIYSSTFQSVKTNGTLYVPIGSSGYDVWMGTRNYYLGKYGWTKVEQ